MEHKHSWPRHPSSHIIGGDGVTKVSRCNDCLAIKVEQAVYNNNGTPELVVVTIVPHPAVEHL